VTAGNPLPLKTAEENEEMRNSHKATDRGSPLVLPTCGLVWILGLNGHEAVWARPVSQRSPGEEVSEVHIKTWKPLFDLEEEMRSAFERIPRFFGDTPFEFRPTIDMVRENGVLVINTEIPGIDPQKNLEIMVEDDMLVIKGEKTAEKGVTDKDRLLHERRYGAFTRRIPLPDGVDPNSLAATYEKGVLKVQVPLPKESAPKQPHQIPIKVS
jgi:HSP20 family protein